MKLLHLSNLWPSRHRASIGQNFRASPSAMYLVAHTTSICTTSALRSRSVSCGTTLRECHVRQLFCCSDLSEHQCAAPHVRQYVCRHDSSWRYCFRPAFCVKKPFAVNCGCVHPHLHLPICARPCWPNRHFTHCRNKLGTDQSNGGVRLSAPTCWKNRKAFNVLRCWRFSLPSQHLPG